MEAKSAKEQLTVEYRRQIQANQANWDVEGGGGDGGCCCSQSSASLPHPYNDDEAFSLRDKFRRHKKPRLFPDDLNGVKEVRFF